MNELFEKKEINPTVRVTLTMNKSEQDLFKKSAKKMNLPLSVFVRLACKNFINGEGEKYAEA
jgi:hypothetical protein